MTDINLDFVGPGARLALAAAKRAEAAAGSAGAALPAIEDAKDAAIAEVEAEGGEQVALATTQAGIATTAAASTATTLASSVRNGGKGEVNDASSGMSIDLLSPNMSRAKLVAEQNPDGTLGRVHQRFSTKTGITEFNLTYAARLSGEQALLKGLQTTSDRAHATSGAMVISLPVNTRLAAGFGRAFYVDTVDEVLRAPGIVPAGEQRADGKAIPNDALVERGGVVGRNRVKRPEQYQRPADAAVLMVQGSAMRPKNKRTHQQCPTMAMSGRYFYTAFSAANKTIGGDYHDAESPDSYVAICRRPIAGGDWEEVAQALPSGPLYRVSDPAMQTINGRVAIFLPLGLKGADTEHFSQGVYVSFLENPDAPTGSKLVFSNPTFTGAYGFNATGFLEKGEFWFPSYIPMNGFTTNSGYFDNTYTNVGSNFVRPGGYLSRFVPGGAPGAPYVERLSRIPGETNTALETYTEPQIIRLHKSLGATYDFWLTTRATTGPREAWGTEATDGRVTWTTLSACTKFNGNAATVRRRIIRTASGNIAYIGNLDPGTNRRFMGVAISQDEAQTFPVQLVAEDASGSPPNWQTSYPDAVSWIDPASGRSKIAIIYDEGRGVGPGLPANFWFHIFDEADLIAGSVTTAQSMAARQLVSQLQYEA